MNNSVMLNEVQRLRGLACLMVLCQHICLVSPMWYLRGIIPELMHYGSGGVHIFFLISGFVISLSLKDKLESCCKSDDFSIRLLESQNVLKSFFIKRFFRIVPCLLCALFLIFMFELIFTENKDAQMQSIRVITDIFTVFHNSNIVKMGTTEPIYLAGSGVFWTLSVEVLFYILWPVWFLLLRNNSSRVKASLMIGIVMWICARWVTLHLLKEGEIIYYASFTNFDGLFLGSFLGLMYNKSGEAHTSSQSKFWCIASFILVSLMWMHPSMFKCARNELWANSTVIISFGLLTIAVYNKGFLNIPVLKNFLEYLGTRSYSFYVYQLFLCYAITWLMNSNYLEFSGDAHFKCSMLFLVVLFIITELSYRFLESPFRKMGNNIANKLA